MLSALFYLGAVAVWLRFRRTATMGSYLAVVALLAAARRNLETVQRRLG